MIAITCDGNGIDAILLALVILFNDDLVIL